MPSLIWQTLTNHKALWKCQNQTRGSAKVKKKTNKTNLWTIQVRKFMISKYIFPFEHCIECLWNRAWFNSGPSMFRMAQFWYSCQAGIKLASYMIFSWKVQFIIQVSEQLLLGGLITQVLKFYPGHRKYIGRT